jgi:hypothetical protein
MFLDRYNKTNITPFQGDKIFMNKPHVKKLSLISAVLCLAAQLPAQADIMIYPAKGQSNQQLSQDRYQCHVWAVQQSGFDPSNPQTSQAAPQQQQGQVIKKAGRGALAGAAIGAIAGNAGKGAAIGATAGGLKGGFDKRDQNLAAQNQAQAAAPGQDNYNGALKACLTGRGYSVN